MMQEVSCNLSKEDTGTVLLSGNDVVKIGVALSGGDIGGVCAYAALKKIEQAGLSIGMLSACGTPSVAAMLYAYGYPEEEAALLTETFLTQCAEGDLAFAIAELSAHLAARKRAKRIPLTVNSVDVLDGHIYAFTEELTLQTGQFTTILSALPEEVLGAAITPMDGLPGGGGRCDFSVWYGCPLAPLRLAGMDRTISLAFHPEKPATPYLALLGQRLRASGQQADIHMDIVLPAQYRSFAACTAAIAAQMEQHLPALLMETLW